MAKKKRSIENAHEECLFFVTKVTLSRVAARAAPMDVLSWAKPATDSAGSFRDA